MRMLKACRCLYRKTPAAALPSECSQTGTFVNARWELSTGNSQVLISLVVRKCVVPCWMVDAKTSHMKTPSLRAT
jgi:hypothetical protein